MEWVNFLVSHKLARGTDGLIDANNLESYSVNKIKESYYCVFNLRKDLLKVEHDTGERTPIVRNPQTGKEEGGKPIYSYHPQEAQVKGVLTSRSYEGPTYPALGLVQFDFDSSDDTKSYIDNVRAAHTDALKFIEWSEVKQAQLAFSGSKGFHVAIPFEAFGLEADEHLCNNLHDMAGYLKSFYPTLDTTVYNANRKFRVLNTQHPKTNLFKTLVPTSMSCEEILEYTKERKTDQYLKFSGVEVSKPLSDALEEAARQHNYDKGKAGTSKRMTPFEHYDGKICIKRIIENKCEEGGRNNTCLIIVNDLYKTGKTKQYAIDLISKWCKDNGLPIGEGLFIVNNIFDGKAYYNHGCQDAIKAANCSAKCPLWSKLDPEKRPVPVDAPKNAYRESTKKTKMSAGRFISEYIQHNVIKVDLSFNWSIYGKNTNFAYIIDKIYCEALRYKASVDPCSRATIEAHLNIWHEEQKESLLLDLQKHIAYGGENGELERWLKAMKPSADSTDLAVMRHWLWQVKRKIFTRPVGNHLMPIFCGLTRTGKSVGIRKLIAPLASVSISPDLSIVKDERQDFNLIENYIMFFDEMAKANTVDVETLKNKVTSDTISYRKLGTNARIKGVNNCSFIGASNKGVIDIIKDPTSARRFYEYNIDQRCDWDTINDIDAHKIWTSIDENLHLGYYELAEEEIRSRQELIRAKDTIEDWIEFKELKANDGVEVREVLAVTLYENYRDFCDFQMIRNPASINKFGRDIKNFLEKKHTAKGSIYFVAASGSLMSMEEMAMNRPAPATVSGVAKTYGDNSVNF